MTGTVAWLNAVSCCVFANREDGQAVLQVKAPDTITSWVASAFAISSDVGLGVASDTARVSIAFCVYVSDLCIISVSLCVHKQACSVSCSFAILST